MCQRFYIFASKFKFFKLRKTIAAYLVYTSLLIGLCLLLAHLFPGEAIFVPKFWGVFAFVAGITLIALTVAMMGIRRNPETGVMFILGSIVIKMLFMMFFVLFYALKTPVGSVLFVLNFFSLYLLFSGFELYCLLRNLRHPIKK